MKSLGEYIKEEREKIGISQRELARRIRVDNKTINNIENNKTKKINFKILASLSKVLEKDIYELGKIANYTKDEIINEIWLNQSHTTDIFNIDFIIKTIGYNEEFIDKYTFIDGNEKYIDIKKVLDGYKNNKLSVEETIILMNACQTIEIIGSNKIIYPSEKENIVIETDY